MIVNKRTPEGRIIRGIINDLRLKPGMKAVANYYQHTFVKHSEEMHKRHIITEHFSIDTPSQSWLARLIDGHWYWVEFCPDCNGMDRQAGDGIPCIEHNTCRVCYVSRDKASTTSIGAVWGHSGGWVCNDCHDALEAERHSAAAERIAERNDEGDTEESMADKPTCPWCGEEEEIEAERHYGCEGEVHDCDACGKRYKLTTVTMIYWDSERVIDDAQ